VQGILIVALATGLRLTWVLLVPTRPVGDFAMYLESAAHLVAHGQLDPEFVYMPGYVLLLALVKTLGGGLLAAKVVGAVLGGLAAGAVHGIARGLWDDRAGLAAGLLYTFWPAGIAVGSVAGTDLPAAALIAGACFFLVRSGPRRPLLAAALFGATMGAAAWIRAVAMPLAVLSAFYFLADPERVPAVRRDADGRGQPASGHAPFWAPAAGWRQVAARTAVACLSATVVLAPWAVRNRLRYGETFFTDSHGGLTALVGANPNSDGRYSRSLNRLFAEVTGHRLLAEPHRLADRESYALAAEFTRFEPLYALGLVVTKAERLLASERPLLYWPLYRAGVLPDPPAGWFARHRAGIEGLADAFYYLVVAAALFGLADAALARRWVALAFIPLQLALIGIYALFFAEVRYSLPIVVLLFPAAGAGLVALVRLVRGGASKVVAAPLALRLAPVACVFIGWALLTRAGAWLRDGHRWAAHLCHVEGRPAVCKWRRAQPGAGDSGVRGVWNGVGLALRPGAGARAEVVLPPGRYRVSAALDLAPVPAAVPGGTASLAAASSQVPLPLATLVADSRAGDVERVDLQVDHPGGPLRLELNAAPDAASAAHLWLGELRIDRAAPDGER
jgi:hypothetical protein